MTVRVKIMDEMEKATAAATAEIAWLTNYYNKQSIVQKKFVFWMVSFYIDGFITWQTKLTVNPKQHYSFRYCYMHVLLLDTPLGLLTHLFPLPKIYIHFLVSIFLSHLQCLPLFLFPLQHYVSLLTLTTAVPFS